MWQPQEDNTYNDLRENSIRQWLEDMSRHEDVAVRGGVKVTAEYLEDLKKQIRQLEEKCALKDAYLKKMKERRDSERSLSCFSIEKCLNFWQKRGPGGLTVIGKKSIIYKILS